MSRYLVTVYKLWPFLIDRCCSIADDETIGYGYDLQSNLYHKTSIIQAKTEAKALESLQNSRTPDEICSDWCRSVQGLVRALQEAFARDEILRFLQSTILAKFLVLR